MRPRTTGLAAAITAKEFMQWIHAFEATSAATTTFLRQRHLHPLNAQHENLDNSSHAEQSIGIAVSGGVDSMALATLLAQHFSLKRGPRASASTRASTKLHAFIVDHKLRDNSTEEANYVAQQVQKLNIVPHVLTLDWSKPDILEEDTHTDNDRNDRMSFQKPDKTHLETQARLRRYRVIAQQCHRHSIYDLFVGHHAGDQVETTIFRLSRSSGIDGLAGIQSIAPLGVITVPEALDIRVIRPLLKVSKERLQATCEEAGTLWVEDPSNRSLDYQRNVIRHYQQQQDSLSDTKDDSEARLLSTAAMLAFRDRMDEHRQAAWKQVTPWIKDIWFDNANGACHLKLGSTAEPSPFTGPGSGSGSESSTVRWLQDSQNHVSTRLLSFLVRWVSCKAHNPRLEDIQSLQQNLRLQQRQFVKPELVSPTALPSLTSSSSTSTSPTVYRKLKQRASKPTSMTLDPIQTMQQQQELRDMSIVAKVRTPFVRMPVTIAGVMFSPPRKTKGVPDHWTISRQPMSQADQISTTVSVPLEDDLDVLWNQRFFLRMIRSKDLSLLSELTRKSEERVQIRPLSAKDVDAVRRRLKPRGQSQNQLGLKQEQRDSDGLKRLDQWLSTVPGNARYTIPVILSPTPTSRIDNCDNDKGRTGSTATCNNILSLPTLGLHFGPTLFTFQSRFKSNPPAGAKDMCYFSQQPTYPLSDKPQDPCSVESLV